MHRRRPPLRTHPCALQRPTSPKAWELIATTLKRSGVTFVSPAQVAAASQRTPIIDVRPNNEYSGGRIPGSVNCEFYRPITGWVMGG